MSLQAFLPYHFNSRLVRQTLGYSQRLAMHQAAAAWEDIVYNFVR